MHAKESIDGAMFVLQWRSLYTKGFPGIYFRVTGVDLYIKSWTKMSDILHTTCSNAIS